MKRIIKSVLAVGLPLLLVAGAFGYSMLLSDGDVWVSTYITVGAFAASAAMLGLVRLFVWATDA